MPAYDGLKIKLKGQEQRYSSLSFFISPNYIADYNDLINTPDLSEIVESITVDRIVTLTQAEYEALVTPDPTILYCIVNS